MEADHFYPVGDCIGDRCFMASNGVLSPNSTINSSSPNVLAWQHQHMIENQLFPLVTVQLADSSRTCQYSGSQAKTIPHSTSRGKEQTLKYLFHEIMCLFKTAAA